MVASKKDKLGPLRNRIKPISSETLQFRLIRLTERVAMDQREIELINKELKGRTK